MCAKSHGRLGFCAADPSGKCSALVLPLLYPVRNSQHRKGIDERAYAGYAGLGGAFYRDVPPGMYHIDVESYGRDINQSADVALVGGQEAYVRVESLRSWASGYGLRGMAGRDTFYARQILPETARVEVAQSFFDGGS
jgi:hypothetical protein